MRQLQCRHQNLLRPELRMMPDILSHPCKSRRNARRDFAGFRRWILFVSALLCCMAASAADDPALAANGGSASGTSAVANAASTGAGLAGLLHDLTQASLSETP